MSLNREKRLPKEVGIEVVKAFVGTGTRFEFSATDSQAILKYNSGDELLLRHAIGKTGYRDPDDPSDR